MGMTIVRVWDEDGKRGPLALLDNDKRKQNEDVRDSAVEEGPTVSLEEIANLLDQDAENWNLHDFVGTHRCLAKLLHQQLGRDRATAVLKNVAEHGGLHRIEDHVKMSRPWRRWRLKG